LVTDRSLNLSANRRYARLVEPGDVML